MQAAISDSTPLIYLAAIDRFSLLRAFHEPVVIPPAVWREVVVQGGGQPGAQEVRAGREEGWMTVQAPKNEQLVEQLRGRLEAGEAEAIALASQRSDHILLVDEHEGRKIARDRHLDVTGTIGLLLRAKQANKIAQLRLELDRLRNEAGFWLADSLYERLLDAVDE